MTARTRPTDNCVLRVLHNGSWKIVGVVWRERTEGLLFLHEESGTQQMFSPPSPGGVDTVVAYWLYQQGVPAIHYYNETTRRLHVTDPLTMITRSTRRQSDGRDRFILPYDYWQERDRTYGKHPWITAEKKLDFKLIDLNAIRASIGEVEWAAMNETRATAGMKTTNPDAPVQGTLLDGPT